MEKETLLAHIFSSPPKVCLPRKSAFLFLAISPVWLQGANRNGSHFFPTGKEIDVIRCAQCGSGERSRIQWYIQTWRTYCYILGNVCLRPSWFQIERNTWVLALHMSIEIQQTRQKEREKKTNFLVGTCFWLKGNYHKLNWNEEKTGRFET